MVSKYILFQGMFVYVLISANTPQDIFTAFVHFRCRFSLYTGTLLGHECVCRNLTPSVFRSQFNGGRDFGNCECSAVQTGESSWST